MRKTWIAGVFVLVFACLERSEGVPLDASSHFGLQPRAAHPEEEALRVNGDLPNGTDTVDGYALNTTTVPNTVAEALSTAAGNIATAEQVDTLMYFLTLSANTYCRTVIAGTWLCPHCSITSDLEFVATFNTVILDTNAIVVRGDAQRTIFIAFRGTSSIENTIADMVILPVPYYGVTGATVHKGFRDSYAAVKAGIIAAVKAQVSAYPEYTLAVTGHSLGGASALLCALDLHEQGYKPMLYTYGQPRVGNPVFANYVVSTGIPYARTVNKRDLVPHIPSAISGFLHAGQEFWIKTDGSVGTYHVCPNGTETSQCSNSIVPFTSAADHIDYFGINCGLCL
ncbi:Alpha/Beta hydrolase protein [Dichotomocladium elegans]|nr:Alpha/Beta hydrolase protein [Dichotomocladium elegans]